MPDRTPDTKKRTTIKDVARAAGVSPGLVSIVLNDIPGASDANRKRVRQVARDLGYQPDARASLLRRRHANLIGVSFFVQSAFHGDLLPGIYASAETAGYEVALSGWTAERPEESAIRALLGLRCDALIILGAELTEPALAELDADVPTVVVGRRLVGPVADNIHTDDGIGMRLAVEHLASLGHRDIAHVDGGRHNVKGEDRVAGYHAAMTALGLADWVRVIPGGQTVEAGADAGTYLLEVERRPSAIVAYDDDCAWGIMAVLQSAGVHVPEQLSVVGYDGSRMSRLVPLASMTTVRQEAETLAKLAVERAVERVENVVTEHEEIILRPTLTVGSSTAPVA